MHLLHRVFFLSVILAGALALTACPSKTTVAKINQNPSRYQNQQVGLIGTVTDSYGLMGNGIYELDDGTGRIWVMTRRGVPSRGTRVGASGRLHTCVSYGGRTYGLVLQEEERRTKSN
jgi:hypothetical protein